MSGPVVVGVDFSDASNRALGAATALAIDLNTTLVLVHAYSSPPRIPGPTGSDVHEAISEVRREIEQDEAIELSTVWADRARKQGVDVETEAGEEPPADLLVKVAKEKKATMIVVASHGRRGLKRLVLGSVADAVLKKATCPVLVVPAIGD